MHYRLRRSLKGARPDLELALLFGVVIGSKDIPVPEHRNTKAHEYSLASLNEPGLLQCEENYLFYACKRATCGVADSFGIKIAISWRGAEKRNKRVDKVPFAGQRRVRACVRVGWSSGSFILWSSCLLRVDLKEIVERKTQNDIASWK